MDDFHCGYRTVRRALVKVLEEGEELLKTGKLEVDAVDAWTQDMSIATEHGCDSYFRYRFQETCVDKGNDPAMRLQEGIFLAESVLDFMDKLTKELVVRPGQEYVDLLERLGVDLAEASKEVVYQVRKMENGVEMRQLRDISSELGYSRDVTGVPETETTMKIHEKNSGKGGNR